MRVLIIDDNRLDAEITSMYLNRKGANSLFTLTLDEFKEQLQIFQPDIIVSDFHMYGFTGMEVINYIEANMFKIPVVIFSNGIDKEILEMVIASGSAFLQKENQEQLYSLLVSLLKLNK